MTSDLFYSAHREDVWRKPGGDEGSSWRESRREDGDRDDRRVRDDRREEHHDDRRDERRDDREVRPPARSQEEGEKAAHMLSSLDW